MTDGKSGGSVDTRERILREAQGLFLERGYHAATLQGIADRVGITKPALYHHFASKAEIFGHLLEPMSAELEDALERAIAESADVRAVRVAMLTGWMDVFLRYRGTLLALVRELASTPSGSFDRLLGVMERAVRVGAGPDGGVAEQIAMAQAVSALTDPIALMPHVPDDVLREQLLAGVWRLLGELVETPRRAGRGGRPRSLSAADAALARELHAKGDEPVDSIAARFGVSRATLYRHLKP